MACPSNVHSAGLILRIVLLTDWIPVLIDLPGVEPVGLVNDQDINLFALPSKPQADTRRHW